MIVHHITRRFTRESWGGTESAVLTTAKLLQQHGHSTKILTSMALAKSTSEEISGIPVERHPHFYPYLGLDRQRRHQLDMTAGNLFSFSMLAGLCEAPPPDVYHLHTGKRLGGIVRVAARKHRRPYIVSLHGGHTDVPAAERAGWTAPTARTLEWGKLLGAVTGSRKVLDDASAILCVNREEQALLQKQYPSKRILWMPNAIDVNRFRKGDGAQFRKLHNIPHRDKVVLNVARIDPQKNQLETLKVYEQAAESQSHLWLVFVGSSTNLHYAQRLDEAIAASPHRRRIIRLGNVEPNSQLMVDLYHGADVFLLNSLHEPFGIVLLEAWAAGLPVVAPKVGGIPSFVTHAKDGLLFASGDLLAATQQLTSVLQVPALAQSLQEQALLKVVDFDLGASYGRMMSVYEEVRREYPLCA